MVMPTACAILLGFLVGVAVMVFLLSLANAGSKSTIDPPPPRREPHPTYTGGYQPWSKGPRQAPKQGPNQRSSIQRSDRA
jgi:hypothetical protein